MEHPSTIFKEKYQSLRRTFESRLASLAESVGLAVGDAVRDEVVLQLSASANTREFAPGHARSLIKRQLAEESSTYFHGLALKLAAAEAEVAALRGNAVHAEHLQIKTTQVNAEIQELRQEYQIALEQAAAECRELKAELADGQHRSTVLEEERDEKAAQARLLQTALADAKARVLESDLNGTGFPRLERELGEERLVNTKLSSDLTHAQEKLGDLAADHQRLKFQAQSLRNDVTQRDKRLQLADSNRKNSEAQFREAVVRMESLLDQEAKDSTSAIKDICDKAALAKYSLSTEVGRLLDSNRQLTEDVAAANAKASELALHTEAALKDKETFALEAAAREKVLQAEVEHARARADATNQSLAEAIREQSGLVVETANAKAAAGVLEAKNRIVELERAETAGREKERAQSCINQFIPSTVDGPTRLAELSDSFGVGMEKILANKLEEASNHISELRTMLHQEIRRREAAEMEVSEAQGCLNNSRQELGELRHLAWKLEQLGRSSIGHIDEKKRTITQLEGQLRVRGVKTSVEQTTAGGGGLDDEDMQTESFERSTRRRATRDSVERYARRQNQQQFFSGGNARHTRMLTALSGLRSDLQGVKAQLGEGKAKYDDFVRQCIEGVAAHARRLTKSVQKVAAEERLQLEEGGHTALPEAQAVVSEDKAAATGVMMRVVQGISDILLNRLGVAVPTDLVDGAAVGEDADGILERGMSQLSAALTEAVARVEETAKQALFGQLPYQHTQGDLVSLQSHQNSTAALDSFVWGDRSKDDFNMLAQLQKIEVTSELQSLRARLEDMTEKSTRAVAKRETVDSAPLQEVRERAKKELIRTARVHSLALATLEATLAAEKRRCQDLKVRLERQTREHQVALAEAGQKFLHTQQELDKVQQALEQTQFTLGIESARRARLEKKHGELDETGLVSPRSLSPRISRQSKAPDPVGADPQTEKTGQPPLARTSSARIMLEEARAKLGQDSDGALVVPSNRRDDTCVTQRRVLDTTRGGQGSHVDPEKC